MAKKEREIVGWITVKGRHVPLYEGESKSDAVKRATTGGYEKSSNGSSYKIIKNRGTGVGGKYMLVVRDANGKEVHRAYDDSKKVLDVIGVGALQQLEKKKKK